MYRTNIGVTKCGLLLGPALSIGVELAPELSRSELQRSKERLGYQEQNKGKSMIKNVEDSVFLPDFANDINRRLADDIMGLQGHLGRANSSLLDNTDTIGVLNEHLGKNKRDVRLASEKLISLSQGFCKNEHKHQMDLRHLVRAVSESDHHSKERV